MSAAWIRENSVRIVRGESPRPARDYPLERENQPRTRIKMAEGMDYDPFESGDSYGGSSGRGDRVVSGNWRPASLLRR
jgi:hypothetical protein